MHGKGAILSEVMSWYLTNGEMSWYPIQGSHDCVFHDTASLDILNFAGNVSLDICKLGHEWTSYLNKAKYSGWIVLVGAGGVIFYLWRKSLKNSSGSPPRSPRLSARSFMKWLLDEELVEDVSDDPSNVHGYYFGPSLNDFHGQYSSNDADEETDSDDLSLNSLSAKSSPCKFLKKPLYDLGFKGNTARFKNLVNNTKYENTWIPNPCPKCEKGTCRLKKHQLPKNPSNSSSCYSESPIFALKTSTPDLLSGEEDQILQRTVASNKLTYRYYRPGVDLRMQGDGSDQVDEVSSATPLSVKSKHGRMSKLSGREPWSLSPRSRSRLGSCSSSPACGDPSCVEPQCYGLVPIGKDLSLDSLADQSCSMNRSMLDLVMNAKETRRLIREISFDSQASDLDIDLSFSDTGGGVRSEDFNQLCNGLNQLIGNCDYIPPFPGENRIKSSRSSESGMSELFDATEDMNGNDSVPDFQKLQKSALNSKELWKLTGFTDSSDHSEAENASLEWESPIHGWHSKPIYKATAHTELNFSESIDRSSSFEGSVVDLWEWDNECLNQSYDIDIIDGNAQYPEFKSIIFNEKGYDGSSETSRNTSRRPSTDLNMRFIPRLPPSGRSSVERDLSASRLSDFSTGSDDVTITSALPPTRSGLKNRSRSGSFSRSCSGSLSPAVRDLPFKFPNCNNQETAANFMNTSGYSEESGFLDYEGSMDSSISSSHSMSSSFLTSSINLSPVKEAKEPNSPTRGSTAFMESPEYGFASITTSDTVIKVTLPTTKDSKPKPKRLPRGLFQGPGEEIRGKSEESK